MKGLRFRDWGITLNPNPKLCDVYWNQEVANRPCLNSSGPALDHEKDDTVGLLNADLPVHDTNPQPEVIPEQSLSDPDGLCTFRS